MWHKLGLNTFSRYRDRAAETLPEISANCYSKTRVLVVLIISELREAVIHQSASGGQGFVKGDCSGST